MSFIDEILVQVSCEKSILISFHFRLCFQGFSFRDAGLLGEKRKSVQMRGLISDIWDFGGLQNFIQIQCLRQKKVPQREENLLFICPYSVIILKKK